MNEGDEQRSWLTRLLHDDPQLLHRAAALAKKLGGGDDAYLAVRRMLDAHLREVTSWPRAADYGMAAHELGDSEDARLLWKVAGTGRLLADHERRWDHRYENRGVTGRERVVDSACSAGEIDYDPDGPVRGIDGAWYAPGYVERYAARGSRSGFVVVVYSAAMAELVTGFADYEAQRRWVAGRGPTAIGPLTAPGLAGSLTPRLVREELILARLLPAPGELADVARSLPPDTFTADGRYVIYAAITAQAAAGARWYASEVAEELDRRVAWLPGGCHWRTSAPGNGETTRSAGRCAPSPARSLTPRPRPGGQHRCPASGHPDRTPTGRRDPRPVPPGPRPPPITAQITARHDQPDGGAY